MDAWNFTQEPSNTVAEGQIRQIEVHKIRPNPAQPRTEFTEEALVTLADSMKQYGILQPLTVRPVPTPDAEGATYELVAGERRLRAAKLLGMTTVPCILIQIDGKKSAELAIIENIQRQDLNIFEEASAIAALIDLYALTQDEIAKRLSTSQSYVANKLRILRLSAFEREKILRHNLTERHARALLRIENAENRAAVLQEVITRGWNVAATEEYIDRFLSAKEPKKKRQAKIILKDIRIFYNTIDKAISTVRNAGVNIISSKAETEDAIELTIRIPKKADSKAQMAAIPSPVGEISAVLRENPPVFVTEHRALPEQDGLTAVTESIGVPSSALEILPAPIETDSDADLQQLLDRLTAKSY